jgi:hypothetical protein
MTQVRTKYTFVEHEDYTEEIWEPYEDHGIPDNWPCLAQEAKHGLTGSVMANLAPNTESDAAGLALQFLTSFGNAIGRGPYFQVEATKHYPNLFTVLAGQTAKARKGTAADRIRSILDIADPEWARNHTKGGVGSGEGILWAIRDPIWGVDKKSGEPKCTDPGVGDKRLLLDEREFFQLLSVMTRAGNTISPILRDAWDGRDHIGSLTKNSPAVVTAPLISIIGHITMDELVRQLDQTSFANGFANRFLFACVRRSQLLPHGGRHEPSTLAFLGRETAKALTHGRGLGRITMVPEAARRWEDVYAELSEERPGLFGAVTARAEAQTVRLALLYALTDCATEITVEHLEAALAMWRFSEASARLIFGDLIGEKHADAILLALRGSPVTGMTRTDIYRQFNCNIRLDKIEPALLKLKGIGKVRCEQRAAAGGAAGRPAEVWFAT